MISNSLLSQQRVTPNTILSASIVLFTTLWPQTTPAQHQLQVEADGDLRAHFDAKYGCDGDDRPDAPLRVVRRSDGQILGFASHFNNFPFHISNGSFKKHCRSAFTGAGSEDESHFNDRGWITALWRDEHTNRITAIVHNEYWGQTHKNKCKYTDYLKCWSNSLNIAVSDNNGETFQLTQDYVLAAGSLPFSVTQGARYGYSNSSNIIYHNGYLYMAAEMIGLGGKYLGTCLMRSGTADISSKWHGWNGNSFNAKINGTMDSEDFECVPLPNLSGVMGSIVRHGNTFIAATLAPHGETPPGFYYSTSSDLLEWSKPKLLFSATPSWSHRCTPGEIRVNLPSLIDLSSADRNFSIVGERAELFFVAGESSQEGDYCRQTNKRLVSIRIRIKSQ